MKKKSCLTLALLLVMIQVISLFAVVPASAADQGRSYYLHPLDFTCSDNSNVVEEGWENIPSSEAFVLCAGSLDRTEAQTFSASFKAAYKDNGNDTLTVYVLLEVKDSTKNNTGSNDKLDGFMFSFENNRTKVYKDFIHGQVSGYGSAGFWGNWTMSNGNKFNVGVADSTTEAAYVAKFSFTMAKTSQFAFDIIVQDNIDGQTVSHAASCERYSWNGMTIDITNAMKANSGAADCIPAGICYIVDESAPITVNTKAGASIRVDTAEENNTTGIRFASSVDMADFNALKAQGAKITTGTLIVPTENLTKKGIEGTFTKEMLESANLVENTHFYDIVNEENEMLSDKNGTWYGTIYGITEYTRAFTAVGYVTVTVGGETNTYYGTPSESRSIAQVAETVMEGEVEGDAGNWNTDQEAILKSFFTPEV